MKLAFSTENIKSESFLELCNKTAEYGFAGFEIFDAAAQKAAHEDSIFRSSMRAGAKRKLINRHINIATLKYPKVISNESFADDIATYVETAAIVGAPSVTVRLEVSDCDTLKAALAPAVKKAETLGVLILIETVGEYAHTEKVLDVINLFETATIGVAWNIRATFFEGKETADNTIQTLGAYISFARIGDRKDGRNVLLGEG